MSNPSANTASPRTADELRDVRMADWTLAELAAELEAATVQDDPNSWDQPPCPAPTKVASACGSSP
jgi:hypothetical protein